MTEGRMEREYFQHNKPSFIERQPNFFEGIISEIKNFISSRMTLLL